MNHFKTETLRRVPTGMMFRWITFGVLIAFAALETSAGSDGDALAPPTPPPSYSAYSSSYHLPFANTRPVDFSKLTGMSVRASINGGPPLRLLIDTGSTGVILGASDVPNIDPNAPPGSITYSSSGIELDGVWTPTTITFPDAKDEKGNVAAAMVPVLAVSERKIHPGAVNGGSAKPSKNPKVYMFGVGSGRGAEVHQERNPWVNLKEMKAGTMRRGYIIGHDGITLGLTPGVVSKDFQFEKLNEHLATSPTTKPVPGSPKDWDSSTGWLTINGTKTQKSGMLLDTGLTNFMIEFPETPATPEVEAGTDITVYLLGGRLRYSFKVGDLTNPLTPRKTSWVKRPAGPLINTGLRVLADFDYLYDADGGYLGLRPVKKP